MIDTIKKSLTLAAIGAFAALMILGSYQVCRKTIALGDSLHLQQALVSLSGTATRCIPQGDSLSYPGNCWKISQAIQGTTQYAFAVESSKGSAIPGGIVAVNMAGIITGFQPLVTFDEALSLKIPVPTLTARRRWNCADGSNFTLNTVSIFGYRLAGISLLKPLQIILRANPEGVDRAARAAALRENAVILSPFETPRYRLLWNELQPAAQAFGNRGYGSVIP